VVSEALSTEPESNRVPTAVHRSTRPPVPARAGALACALAATACASFGSWPPAVQEPEPAAAPEAGERTSWPSSPELMLTTEDDFAVRVLSGSVTCTGALVAEDRVLTAHHCVTARSAKGDILPQLVEPSSIHVELGGDELPWGEVSVRAIVVPSCGYAGGEGDVAVLVLTRALHGIRPRMVELDGTPSVGQMLTSIGFGRCADASDGTYRKRRPGSSVRKVVEGRLEFQAAICPGDSGGPALDHGTGRIVGVVSRSVMDANESTLGLTELARVDSFRGVFATAAQVAAGVSLSELPPVGCRQ
jgi:hypothetical protein